MDAASRLREKKREAAEKKASAAAKKTERAAKKALWKQQHEQLESHRKWFR